MNKEKLRLQMLSGIITEGEYKAKLEENSTKESLNENFVGMGMVGNIFDREKTDYELAFEHFTKGKMVTENIGTTLDKLLNTFEFSQKGNDEMIELANYILSPEGPKNIAMSIKNKLKGEGGEKYFTSNPEALNTLLSKLNVNENFNLSEIKEIEGDPDDYYGYQEPINPKDYADDLEEKISKDDEKLYRAFIKAANFLKGGGSDDEAWKMMWDEYPYM